MNYTELSTPTSRADQCRLLIQMEMEILSTLLSLVQAPTASGKSSNMAAISTAFWEKHKFEGDDSGSKAIIICLAHNESMVPQLISEFENAGFVVFTSKNPKGKPEDSSKLFRQASTCKKKCVTIFHGITHANGEPIDSAVRFKGMIDHAHGKGFHILVHIDELHKQLTSLTGGINSTYEVSSTKLKHHRKVIEPNDINIFDWLRECNAMAIGWSATLHNVIASRIHSFGYAAANMRVINIPPIPGLYPTEDFIYFNDEIPEDYLRKMLAEEARGKPILAIFSSKEELDKFKGLYLKIIGRQVSDTTITSEKPFSTVEELKESLRSNQYVLGINMITTGFDLFSFIGKNFGSIFVFREFSDKGSATLSHNENSDLYCETSASFAQAIGRARDSDCRIYTCSHHEQTNIPAIQQRFFELTKKASVKATSYGPPATTQREREYAGIYVSICQNITNGKELIKRLLTWLHDLTGRHLEEEYAHEDCDHLFWRGAVEELWETISPQVDSTMPEGVRIEDVLKEKREEREKKEREEREKKEREEREKKEREEKEREEREKKEREEREKKEREKKEREKKEREKKEREKKEREAATNEERERTIVTSGGSEGQERQKPAGLLAELLEISGNRCGHCGERFVESDPPEISHFLPHSLKGEASIENCLPSHHLCNSAHDTVNQLLDIDNAHYWVRGAYTGKPLRQSINMLDPDNIYANWKRAMEHLQIPKRVDQREHLIKHGFTKLPLPL